MGICRCVCRRNKGSIPARCPDVKATSLGLHDGPASRTTGTGGTPGAGRASRTWQRPVRAVRASWRASWGISDQVGQLIKVGVALPACVPWSSTAALPEPRLRSSGVPATTIRNGERPPVNRPTSLRSNRKLLMGCDRV
jgi:hypothetical protein